MRGRIAPISGPYSSVGAPPSSSPIGSASLIARSTAATSVWYRVSIGPICQSAVQSPRRFDKVAWAALSDDQSRNCLPIPYLGGEQEHHDPSREDNSTHRRNT